MFSNTQIPDKISYSVAKKREPRIDKSFICTSVSWKGAPIITELIEFTTIGAVEVILPPPLPRGCVIDRHDQWIELVYRIYDKNRVLSMAFDELDNVERDIKRLEKVTGKIFGDWYHIYDDRPDYCKYTWDLDESWEILGESIRNPFSRLFEKANPHLDPHSRQEDGIGNRVMPPSLREALANMFGADIPGMVDRIAERLESCKEVGED